jgi:hypothetical protein
MCPLYSNATVTEKLQGFLMICNEYQGKQLHLEAEINYHISLQIVQAKIQLAGRK